MKLRHLFLSVLWALGALAQPAPVITSISPTQGPSSGGTAVTITGDNLDTAIVCALPCPPTVTFGNVTVEAREESKQRLTVVTPAHPPGTVDLTITIPGREPLRQPAAFTFTPGAEDAYERILLPVYVEGVVHGAHGSEWASSLWIRNGGNEAVQLAPWPCTAEVCLPVIPNTSTLGSGAALHGLPPFFTPPTGNPGRILYVSRPGSQDVAFGLRAADVSRSSENAGTDIPVVRDAELLTRQTDLLDVPLNARFRVLLRIYELAYTSSDFRVTLYPQATGITGPVQSIALTATTAQASPFRTQPAFAQFDVSRLLDQDDKTWPAAVRIEITPMTPGSRYWAFASITNNDTQLITVATPQ